MSRALNLLMVSRAVVQHGIGGMERHCRDLCEGLVSKGHRVTILTSASRDGIPELSENGVHIRFLPNTAPAVYSDAYHESVRRETAAMHAREPFDAMLSESAGVSEYVIQTPRAQRPPCIPILHGTDWMEIGSVFAVQHRLKRYWYLARYILPDHRPRIRRARAYLPMCDRVVCVGEYVAKRARKEYRLGPDKLRVIHNGIPLDQYRATTEQRRAMRAKLELEDDTLAFLCIGRFSDDKGFATAIDAFGRLAPRYPRARMLMVGDGPERDRLRGMAGDKALFTGRVAQDDTAGYYAAADALLIPSLRYEGLPYTLIEGAAYGLAIITTRRGGQGAELVDGETGLLFDAGDVRGCEQAMERLLASSAGTVGANARRLAEARYDLTKMVDAFNALIFEAIG